MICFPNAKINIGLNILEKRADGLHNIESVFYPIAWCDVLEVVESKAMGFSSSGIAIPGAEDQNLCLKAYQLLAKDYPMPAVNIHLHKIIPVGAGLGGGSSDAAFFIKLLNEKFDLGLSWGELHHYSKQLGSDCSFFIGNRPSFVEGTGDKMESILLDLKGYYIVLVCPPIHVSTEQAYSSVKPSKPIHSLEQDVLQLPIKEWRNRIKNDFEESLFSMYPVIKDIKEKLYSSGALYASMSGSGSSVYGIFEKEIDLSKNFPDCLVRGFRN